MKAREKQGRGAEDTARHFPGGAELQKRVKPAVRWGGVLGGAALLGLLLVGRHAALRRPARPAAPAARSPFEASFTAAQRWYFRAQVIAKEQLEALEEWDSRAAVEIQGKSKGKSQNAKAAVRSRQAPKGPAASVPSFAF
jgi:hypothetical protein